MKKLLFIACGFFALSGLQSQSLTPVILSSTGDHFSNQQVQLSWTVGESITESFSDGDNILTQGFHQSRLIVTSVHDDKTDIEIKIFPNPTQEILSIKWNQEINLFKLNVFDARGISILSTELDSGALNASLDLSDMVSGFYFIQFKSRNNQIVQTFKILKI